MIQISFEDEDENEEDEDEKDETIAGSTLHGFHSMMELWVAAKNRIILSPCLSIFFSCQDSGKVRVSLLA